MECYCSTGCPATVRPVTTALAKLTRGRCFSVDYRLSPQNSFPGALVDVLRAYLSLLYPPPGSYHKAVSSRSIVLAGESSGACLVLALLLIIQQLRPSQQIRDTELKASGSRVEVPFPAGVALYAAEGDHTHCL
jgi:acetyl esterase/lipase